VGGALLAVIVLVGVAFILIRTGSDVDSSANPGVQRLAEAIATAEGFFSPGSRAARNHNPGDMTQDLIGRAVGVDGPFVVYGNDADGWANLFAQINMWIAGRSQHATAESTISDLSGFYTADNQSGWAINVANHLGVSVDTSIAELIA
jgi:hypothetical protein